MRILLIGNSEGLGGAQTAFKNLAGFCVSEGNRTAIVAISDADSQDWPEQIEFCKRIPYSVNNPLQRIHKAILLSQVVIAARIFQPDVFVTVGLAMSANAIARFLSRNTFKVAQDFIHGRLAADPLLAASSAAFDAIAVQAPAMIGGLRQSGFTARPVTWLPCFPEPPVVDVAHDSYSGRQPLRFAYFGRLAANKGLPMLVSALALASSDVPVELDIWGSGPEENLIRETITSLDMGSRVSLCGRYPDGAEAARLMCGYDALLLTSTGTEGLPLILLEAMAYGLPFLVTDVGAIRDCCDGNPDVLLVQPDEVAIASGLSELVRRLAAGEIKPERLRGYYQKYFSPAVMGDRWRAFFQQPQSFLA